MIENNNKPVVFVVDDDPHIGKRCTVLFARSN